MLFAFRTTGGLRILSTNAWNLWVFLNIAADALVFLQNFAYRQIIKLSLQFVHGVVGMICVPHIIFDKHLVLLDWPGSLAIIIESQATVPKISAVKPAASLQYVPSFFLSNVMSLAPKIDEVNSVAINANVDVVCITETWLQSHIPDSVVAINGYNLIRRDRRDARHGGVCMYIK